VRKQDIAEQRKKEKKRKKLQVSLDSDVQETKDGYVQQVYIYRMPWQTMSSRNIEIINISLFFFWVYALANFKRTVSIVYDWSGSLSAPFDLFILPGLFFYGKYKEQWLMEEVNILKYIKHQKK